ncbi:MAG: hypothetical protein LBT06_01195 [Hungatella sp.]|jgi:hypothetical protein|nr:hypothetical protein [Hungatella sp.]
MNIRKNIYDFINDYHFLDPTVTAYSGVISEKDHPLMEALWNEVKNIYINNDIMEDGEKSLHIFPEELPYLIFSNPNLISSYFSDLSTVLEKIQPEILMQLYHAVMNLQINRISISELFKKPFFNKKDNKAFQQDIQETEDYKAFYNQKSYFKNLMEEFHTSTSTYVFPELTDYVFNSIYYNGKKDTSVAIYAQFPEIVLKCRIDPSLIPNHYYANPSNEYLKKLEDNIKDLREGKKGLQLLLFDYEVETLIGFNRLYSALQYLLDVITSLPTQKEMLKCINIYEGCFKLLYQLPISLHNIYGPRLVKTIFDLQKATIGLYEEAPAVQDPLTSFSEENGKVRISPDSLHETRNIIRKPLDSLVNEMILINNILLPEITTFMALKLHTQFTFDKSYKNFDHPYIIEQFNNALNPETFENIYEVKDTNPLLNDATLLNKNKKITPTFIKRSTGDILLAVLPNNTTLFKRFTRIEWKKYYRTAISVESYVQMVYDQIITMKQFVIPRDTPTPKKDNQIGQSKKKAVQLPNE